MKNIKNNKIIQIFLCTAFFQSTLMLCSDPRAGTPSQPLQWFHHDPYDETTGKKFLPFSYMPSYVLPLSSNQPIATRSYQPESIGNPNPDESENQDQKNIETLERLLETGYGRKERRTSKYQDKRNEQFYSNIAVLLAKISPSTLETINKNTGQAWVHSLTPLHWDMRLIQLLASQFNLSVASVEPDQNPGSTIAHYVTWRTIHNINREHYWSTNFPRAIQFIAWFIQKYPETLHQISRDNCKSCSLIQAIQRNQKIYRQIKECLSKNNATEMLNELNRLETKP